MCRKMNFLGLVIVLVFLVVSTITLGVKAQTTETTLEFTVRQVVVEDGVASITGPAAGSRVELYDNLGKELISSGTSDANGKVAFPLDDKYPLSAKGLFYTSIKVDGFENGVFTCQLGQTCHEIVFTVDGLIPDRDDGILIVKVVRSNNYNETVGGIKVAAWPRDKNGTPLKLPIVGFNGTFIYDWSGAVCITNGDGYCAAYLKDYFKWSVDNDNVLTTDMILKVGAQFTYDKELIKVPEGGLIKTIITVDEKGKLDDCIFRSPPSDRVVNQSCKDKLHQTATAQAMGTVNPADYEVYNNALIQASLLSKETMDLFTSHELDTTRISEFLDGVKDAEFDSVTQVKIILHIVKISNDGMNAYFDGPAAGKLVEITSPYDPNEMLGACMVNSLGECIVIINRNLLQIPGGLIQFHILADGYDNGNFICQDELICEQNAYTITNFSDDKDVILMFKVVDAVDYSKPVPNQVITAGNAHPVFGGGGTGFEPRWFNDKRCISDENGSCPIYIPRIGFKWEYNGENDYVIPIINIITSNIGRDTTYPYPYDDELAVYYIAVNNVGGLVDCTFTSPLMYELDSKIDSPDCFTKKRALQTAIAGYTATPLPSSTPTATEVPPTPTITLTPSPTPASGSSKGKPAFESIGVGVLVLVVLLGGGAWLVMRSRKQRKH